MPLSPSQTKSLLDRLGHRPKRRLGQNFLIDGNIVRKSLQLAKVESGDRIVEIGPGLGTLTEGLLAAGACVNAVEKDPILYNHLLSLEGAWKDNLTLEQGDALKSPLANLSSDVSDFKIVANLPYAISTPWMAQVLEGPLPISMTLMLQKEAAQRYVAKSGSKQFGGISIFLQAAFEMTARHNVAAACFYPKPDIDSTLLHLTRKNNAYSFSSDAKDLIRRLFQQRRKQVGSLLKQSDRSLAKLWLQRLPALGIPIEKRPEQIEVEKWMALDSF